MKRKCIIWGTDSDYERIINQIKYEELKGNIECIAILPEMRGGGARKLDSYTIISCGDIANISFDYLIIAAANRYDELKAQALALGIPNKAIISSKVMTIPNFDFSRYFSLREDPVTILSDDCWGGYIYHDLDLPFTSPLINISWQPDSYCRFIQDPIYYFRQPLQMVREGNPRRNLTPIGRLGEENQSVELHFVHEPSFTVACTKWERRVQRINPNRIFVKFGLNASEPNSRKYLSLFDKVPYTKIGTYSGETNVRDVFYSREFETHWYNDKRIEFNAFNDWIRQPQNMYTVIDIFKLLNGESDYSRIV